MSQAVNRQRQLPRPVVLLCLTAQVAIAGTCLSQAGPTPAGDAAVHSGSRNAVTPPAPMEAGNGAVFAVSSALPQMAPQTVPLISIHGAEPFFCCTLGPVNGYMGEYVFDVYKDGTIQGAFFFRDAGASLADPPTGSKLFSDMLTSTDLRNLLSLIGSARLGIQGDCQGGLPFFGNGNNPRQRLYWYGRGSRENDFALFEGAPCSSAVQAIVAIVQVYSVPPIPIP
jgi:hypothetical protein